VQSLHERSVADPPAGVSPKAKHDPAVSNVNHQPLDEVLDPAEMYADQPGSKVVFWGGLCPSVQSRARGLDGSICLAQTTVGPKRASVETCLDQVVRT